MARGVNVPVGVGVVGCGTISEAYLRNMSASPYLKVVACADQVLERAQARAKQFGVPHACTTDELLRSDEVELVVNLTIPLAHAEISLAALRAGKHVFTEKPIAATLRVAVKALYGDSPYGYPAIGTTASVKAITREGETRPGWWMTSRP